MALARSARSLSKTIVEPDGENAGLRSSPGVRTSDERCPLEMSTRQMSCVPLDFVRLRLGDEGEQPPVRRERRILVDGGKLVLGLAFLVPLDLHLPGVPAIGVDEIDEQTLACTVRRRVDEGDLPSVARPVGLRAVRVQATDRPASSRSDSECRFTVRAHLSSERDRHVVRRDTRAGNEEKRPAWPDRLRPAASGRDRLKRRVAGTDTGGSDATRYKTAIPAPGHYERGRKRPRQSE